MFPCDVGEFAFPCFVFWIEKSPGVRWSSVNTEEDRVACRNLCLHAHSSACEQVGLSDSWCVRVVEQVRSEFGNPACFVHNAVSAAGQ